MEFLNDEIMTLKSSGLYRQLKQAADSSRRTRVHGRECILLSSNNYLGLTEHPAVIAASVEAVKSYGAGAGGARLISGNFLIHEELEREIARFKGTDSAVVFNTGYMANLGVISALTGSGDVVISDQLNHASIIDGCRLSRADTKVYRHRDMTHLEELLKQCRGYRRRLIVTDGVFSMDGDIAPLPEIAALAERYDAMVMVDDAHATGALGARGAGTVEYFRLEGKIPVQMGTLGKALGSFGAYVAGSHELIDFLRNKARSFIFSTALPPAVIGSAMAAIRVLKNNPEMIKKLWANAGYFRSGLEKLGYHVLNGESHILAVLIGDDHKTMQLASLLLEKGVFAPGIRPPTVPPGTGRIRVTVMATHSRRDLDEALIAFEQAGRQLELI